TRRTPDVVATRRPDPAPALLPAGEGTPSPVERVVRRLRRARFRSKVLRRPLVEVRRLGLGPDDALIASYPRSGTNWLMFLVAEAITGEPSQFGAVHRRIPYIGGQRRAPRLLPDGGRIVYTHETHPIGRRRAVYLVRDPRDVVLSEYRWQQMTGVFDGDLDTFVDAFVTGRGSPWGAWDRHVRRGLARADEPGSPASRSSATRRCTRRRCTSSTASSGRSGSSGPGGSWRGRSRPTPWRPCGPRSA